MSKIAMISTVTAVCFMLGGCLSSKSSSAGDSYPILNAQGLEIGKLNITPLSKGGVELEVSVEGLTPGSHAMHFHEFGKCDTPNFKSAGGHYNPDGAAHGSHVGDMMNVIVQDDGTGTFEVTNEKVSLKHGDLPLLIDADGTALIIHAGADDYTSQPSGAAGPRVACAIITASK